MRCLLVLERGYRLKPSLQEVGRLRDQLTRARSGCWRCVVPGMGVWYTQAIATKSLPAEW